MITFGDLEGIDFGPFARFLLALANRGLILVRGDNRDTTSADSNGVGKSHLFRALAWGLFGTTIEGDKGPELIRNGAKKMVVIVPFTDGETAYIVTRTHGRGAGLALTRNGEDISGITVKDTQAEINRLLGMDFLTFRNTVYYGQDDATRFASHDTDDSDRKAVAKRIFRLEVLDKAKDRAKAARDAAATRAQALEFNIPTLEARLEAIDTEAIQARIDTARTAKAEGAKRLARKPRIAKSAKSIEGLLADYAKKRTEARATEAKMSELGEAAAEKGAEARGAEQEANNLGECAAEFDVGNCPTCGTPSDSSHVVDKVNSYLERQTAARATAAAALTEATRLRAERAELAEVLAASREATADEQDWRDKLATTRADLQALEAVEAELAATDETIAEAEAELAEAEASREALTAEMEAARVASEAAREEERHADFWVRGFGNSGLPSHILDGAVPEMTERANHYLRILTDGDISIKFDTLSTLKSGETRDKFAIVLDVEGAGNKRPSGGQGRKVALASDIALMDLVANRERAAIDFMGLDEVLDGLDASGRARVMDLLNELRKSRSTILVVSHDPSIAEMFETVVTVVKEGGVARLE